MPLILKECDSIKELDSRQVSNANQMYAVGYDAS